MQRIPLRFALLALALAASIGLVAVLISGMGLGLAPQASGTSCNTGAARAEFGLKGHLDRASDPIYLAWLHRWCAHVNLGPATTGEFNARPSVVGQNFSETASRITWSRRTKKIAVQNYPRQALKVFAGHKVQPQWGTTLTVAWLSQFYSGHNWGPALDPAQSISSGLRQVFQRGIATESKGAVAWKAVAAGSKSPWLYQEHQWLPIGQTVGAFNRAVARHNQFGAGSYLTSRLQAKVATHCIQTVLGFSGWPHGYGYSVRVWSPSTSTVASHYSLQSGRAVDYLHLVHGRHWRIASVQRSRQGSVACPPWSPPLNAFTGTFAVGDSVMVDAQPYLTQMGIAVDAQVSRQFDTGVGILRDKLSQGTLPPRVVVALGTNGPMTGADFNGMMSMLRHEKRVVVLTVREPRYWQDQVNAVVRAGVARWKNARLADWYRASAGHPEYFAPDGVHLQGQGPLAFTHVIANALGGP